MRVRVVPCAEDCPNEAIAVVPSRDRARYLQTAVVTPAKCVGCGICAGAGDSAGIRLGDRPRRHRAAQERPRGRRFRPSSRTRAGSAFA